MGEKRAWAIRFCVYWSQTQSRLLWKLFFNNSKLSIKDFMNSTFFPPSLSLSDQPAEVNLRVLNLPARPQIQLETRREVLVRADSAGKGMCVVHFSVHLHEGERNMRFQLCTLFPFHACLSSRCKSKKTPEASYKLMCRRDVHFNEQTKKKIRSKIISHTFLATSQPHTPSESIN